MFKTKKIQIINNDQQLFLLKENPNSPATSAPFDGWGTSTICRILPFADQITADQIVEVRRTIVTANNTPLAQVNYSAQTTGTIVAAPNAILTSRQVRRAAPQVATLQVTGVPAAGSNVLVKVMYNSIDRSRVEFNHGAHKVLPMHFRIPATVTTNTQLAQLIRNKMLETFSANDDTVNTTVTGVGDTLTITWGENGMLFNVYTAHTNLEIDDIPATFTVTSEAFGGVNDFNWLKSNVQTVYGHYRIDTGETDFLPIKGAYYNSYFIRYRVDKPLELWVEHQQGTINAEQSHIVDLELYVNQSATRVISELNLFGGF